MFQITIKCKYCKDSVIIQDRVTYEHICIECGLIVEDSRICEENIRMRQAKSCANPDRNNKAEMFSMLKTSEILWNEQTNINDKRFRQLQKADSLLYNICGNFGLENAINPLHDVNLTYMQMYTNERYCFEKILKRKSIIKRALPQFRNYFKIENYIEIIGKRLCTGSTVINQAKEINKRLDRISYIGGPRATTAAIYYIIQPRKYKQKRMAEQCRVSQKTVSSNAAKIRRALGLADN